MSHTPGPWKLDEFNGNTIWGPYNEHIADVRGYGAGLPQEANAQLLTASPEMLDSLRKLVACCAHCTIPLTSVKAVRQMGKFLDAVEKANAAIRKAEGK
jgi:hypothetical protein